MIEHLSGTVAHKRETHVTLAVGGVGFGVNIPLSTYRELPRVNEPVFLHTRLILREDDVQLYGFMNPDERDLFDVLLGISGVGARVALDIISHLPIARLAEAVQTNTPSLLTTVPGIGKKRAEKLIFDLARLKNPILAATAQPPASPDSPAPLPDSTAAQDAFEALQALGMRPPEAQRALNRALEAVGTDTDTALLIREALKHR